MAVQTSVASARRVPHVDVGSLGLSALTILQLAAALAFVAFRITMPDDGTRVGGAANPWTMDGVVVAPAAADATTSQVRVDDLVVAVHGRPVEAWLRELLAPGVSRPQVAAGEPVELVVQRGNDRLALTTVASRFDPLGAIAEDWGVVALALSIQIVGLYLFYRRPREPAARALLITGTGMFASSVPWALGMQVSDVADPSGFWLNIATTGLAYALFWCGALHFALVFPHPVPFVAGRFRVVWLAYVLPLVAFGGFIAVAGLASGSVLGALEGWLTAQGAFELIAILVAIGLMGYSYWRLGDPVSRRQLRLIAGAVGLAALSNVLLWFGPELLVGAPLIPPSAVALLALPFPVALAIAVDRHHLFDLESLVNRSIVYGALTFGVVATYAATVALIGGFIPGNAPFAIALLGAGAVAVVALPLRDRLQGWVNRMMYGDRDDPDSALRRLGRRLEATLDPQTVLSTLVETVAESLRSPFVAIELERDGEYRVEASYGVVPVDARGARDQVRLPIVYRGRPVGRLVLCPRDVDASFSPADERLVADLARQAAPAVEAVRLTADLRRSREELVATREEERRRLRRDLHDELGPAMAGSLMKLRAARQLMASDETRATSLLDQLEGDVGGMIDEIRRIAHNLRPPALDELGLVGLLRIQVAAFDGGPPDRPFQVSLEAPADLPALPAAVEVAGLRIALEGLMNAAKHSGGSHARVGLAIAGDALVVSVRDDGVGVPAGASPGVGLTSMRERADELGGKMEVVSSPAEGTTIIATLPLAPGRAS